MPRLLSSWKAVNLIDEDPVSDCLHAEFNNCTFFFFPKNIKSPLLQGKKALHWHVFQLSKKPNSETLIFLLSPCLNNVA